MKNIVLIGFMGSGKTLSSHILSDRLNMDRIDSDLYIESRHNLSIADIFSRHGEAYFRDLERQFIESFSHTNNKIISTGGGMPIFNDISLLGISIYLRASFEILKERVVDSNRPLFKDIDKARELYRQREPIYTQKADFIVNADNAIDCVVKDILDMLHDKAC